MSPEFLSIAIWRPVPGKEDESLDSLRELGVLIARKKYGRDLLYRTADTEYLLLRYWNSEEARRTAMEDPDLLRCWAKLANEIRTIKVYEKLAAVDLS
jgi:hypothetical protein